MTEIPKSPHRWSGWPGAWCLDCGQEDPAELALAGVSDEELIPLRGGCPEPGSKRHDPYAEKEKP